MLTSTWENPHTFAEAVEYLRAGNPIDYDVKIGSHHGALMTREEWLDNVRGKSFIDYDGMGNEVDENGSILGKDELWIYPSTAKNMLPETKYILWYNR
jgi:hypothetical protein